MIVAGVDCSTQATKVVLIDADTGALVGEGRSEHRVTGIGGARETVAYDWWEALRVAIAQTGRGRDVAAISVGAQQHGLVVVDGTGRPLRPAILWNDVRSSTESARLIETLGGAGAAAALIGSVPLTAFTVTSWMWLRAHEPEVVDAARGIRLPHDWLNEQLTGRATTDRGDVSATGWWSSVSERYLPEVLGLADVGIAPSLLPEVLGPNDLAGEVSAAAADFLGLRAGIPVGPGTGDNPAAALGLGLTVGETVLSLGTSGTVYSVRDRPTADRSGTVVGLADATGRWLPLACTLNCTLAVDKFASLLGLGREDVEHPGDTIVFPFLDGERTPDLPQAAGLVSGLRHSTSAAQVLSAAYEGAVFALLEAAALVSDPGDDAPLILIGGGARGRAWRDAVRRLSGRAIEVPRQAELVAIGAAVQAATALSGSPSGDIAQAWRTRAGDREEPVPLDERRRALLSAALADARPLLTSNSRIEDP